MIRCKAKKEWEGDIVVLSQSAEHYSFSGSQTEYFITKMNRKMKIFFTEKFMFVIFIRKKRFRLDSFFSLTDDCVRMVVCGQ